MNNEEQRTFRRPDDAHGPTPPIWVTLGTAQWDWRGEIMWSTNSAEGWDWVTPPHFYHSQAIQPSTELPEWTKRKENL